MADVAFSTNGNGSKKRTRIEKNRPATLQSIRNQIRELIHRYQRASAPGTNRLQMAVLFFDQVGFMHCEGSELIRTAYQKSDFKIQCMDRNLWSNQELVESEEIDEEWDSLLIKPSEPLNELNRVQLEEFLQILQFVILGGRQVKYKDQPKPAYWPIDVKFASPQSFTNFSNAERARFPTMADLIRYVIRYIFWKLDAYHVLAEGPPPLFPTDASTASTPRNAAPSTDQTSMEEDPSLSDGHMDANNANSAFVCNRCGHHQQEVPSGQVTPNIPAAAPQEINTERIDRSENGPSGQDFQSEDVATNSPTQSPHESGRFPNDAEMHFMTNRATEPSVDEPHERFNAANSPVPRCSSSDFDSPPPFSELDPRCESRKRKADEVGSSVFRRQGQSAESAGDTAAEEEQQRRQSEVAAAEEQRAKSALREKLIAEFSVRFPLLERKWIEQRVSGYLISEYSKRDTTFEDKINANLEEFEEFHLIRLKSAVRMEGQTRKLNLSDAVILKGLEDMQLTIRGADGCELVRAIIDRAEIYREISVKVGEATNTYTIHKDSPFQEIFQRLSVETQLPVSEIRLTYGEVEVLADEKCGDIPYTNGESFEFQFERVSFTTSATAPLQNSPQQRSAPPRPTDDRSETGRNLSDENSVGKGAPIVSPPLPASGRPRLNESNLSTQDHPPAMQSPNFPFGENDLVNTRPFAKRPAKRFRPQCQTCKQPIAHGEGLKTHGKTVHASCFRCAGCQRPMGPGRQVVLNKEIYCQIECHQERIVREEAAAEVLAEPAKQQQAAGAAGIQAWIPLICDEHQQISDDVISACLKKIQAASNHAVELDRFVPPSIQAVKGQVRMNHKPDFTKVVAQVHFLPDHWVASAKFPGNQSIFIYDSSPMRSKITSNAELRRHILEFYFDKRDKEDDLSVEYCMLPKQRGNYACGVFALAYITAIALGVDPASVSFRQGDLRKHLADMLTTKGTELKMFPHSIRSKKSESVRHVLYAFCCGKRVPEGQPSKQEDVHWVKCEVCKDWYHLVCLTGAYYDNAITTMSFGTAYKVL